MTFENDGRGISQSSADDLNAKDIPAGVERRAFMMRSAVIGATAVIAGCSRSDVESPETIAAAAAKAPPPWSPELEVVKKAQKQVLTTLDEFYKVAPRLDFDTTVAAMALTAKEMNAKYKTSEGGLAVSVTLC